ncbi:MAG TPA: hypothetical protein VLJ39_17820 [Tepidisphaeraceae bacterium]|nr:hypothetical protein [Tepidisphaeraceae bacterium]
MALTFTRLTGPLICVCAAALLATPDAGAVETDTPANLTPAKLPSTRPADPVRDSLIKQLGAEDFKERQSATEQLYKMGADALPALKEAATSDNPEIRTRAQRLINNLEHRNDPPKEVNASQNTLPLRIQGRFIPGLMPVPLPPGMRFRIVGRGMMHGGRTVRNATSNINGDTYKLHEDPEGLTLTVTEAGKITEYSAKNADDLKARNPEGYRIYEKLFGEDAQFGRPMIRIIPAPPPATQPRQ